MGHWFEKVSVQWDGDAAGKGHCLLWLWGTDDATNGPVSVSFYFHDKLTFMEWPTYFYFLFIQNQSETL